MRKLICIIAALPAVAMAQGWGNVATQEKPKQSWWTSPLWPEFWMAWTPATLAVFVFIFSAMGILTTLEVVRPGGDERRGVLGLTTTRGDRLFISLLGSSYIFLAWLGLIGMPLYAPLALACLWGIFCFWKV